ncbi:MAG: polysaccharide biosynthesis/export family protein [Pyrinomonadaceae bacterium]
MKIKATLKAFALAALLAVMAQATVFAQDEVLVEDAPRTDVQEQKKPSEAGSDKLVTDEKSAVTNDAAAGAQDAAAANHREQLSEEEQAVLPYYNNYLTNYYLGPEDVISVTVFGQDRYSKSGITVPPNGKISYPLVGSILVAGKTTEQIEVELTKRLDEYIIDPKVSVALDKAMSSRYSVLGDVGQPGIKTMSRRVSILEALAEAGGVLPTGDKKKVVILRRQADGNVKPIPINFKEIESGTAKEMAYLVPGDQVVVPGNKLKTVQKIMGLLPILSFARIFGLPF